MSFVEDERGVAAEVAVLRGGNGVAAMAWRGDGVAKEQNLTEKSRGRSP